MDVYHFKTYKLHTISHAIFVSEIPGASRISISSISTLSSSNKKQRRGKKKLDHINLVKRLFAGAVDEILRSPDDDSTESSSNLNVSMEESVPCLDNGTMKDHIFWSDYKTNDTIIGFVSSEAIPDTVEVTAQKIGRY